MQTVLDYLRADFTALPLVRTEVACITVERTGPDFLVWTETGPVYAATIEDAARIVDDNK